MITSLRTPANVLIAIALVAAAATAMLTIVLSAWPAVAPSAIAVICAGFAIALGPRREEPTTARLLEKVSEQAESGRKLVIYERETGLFAHWYLALRGDEECNRARRYNRGLSLLLIEPSAPENAWTVKDDISRWIGQNLRATDVAGYLGNGRYVVIMPESTQDGTSRVIERISNEIAGVALSSSEYGADGASYNELYEAAAARLRDGATQLAA